MNFLDLLDILIHCPDSPKRQEKIDDISLLFIHMHHLINEFRPHQVKFEDFIKAKVMCDQLRVKYFSLF